MNSPSDLRVVAIGGGTGLSVLLRGLKQFTTEVTAVVNVVDDGGGSGRLREDLGMLPPGDIRSCLVALAEADTELQKLFQYRFTEGELSGQNFGNLFLAAMNNVYGTFDQAVQKTADILAITGRVLPMTLEDVALVAECANRTTVTGESVIPGFVKEHKTRIERVYMTIDNPEPLPETLEAIRQADMILIGPGSLYTSVIPNVLVGKVAQACRDAKAPVIYIANVMTQSGETDDYTLRDHTDALFSHAGGCFVDEIYYNEEPVPEDVRKQYYETDQSIPVTMTPDEKKHFEAMGIKTVGGPFIEVMRNYIRTDSRALCGALFENHTRVFRGLE